MTSRFLVVAYLGVTVPAVGVGDLVTAFSTPVAALAFAVGLASITASLTATG